jgi:hypothetical protein
MLLLLRLRTPGTMSWRGLATPLQLQMRALWQLPMQTMLLSRQQLVQRALMQRLSVQLLTRQLQVVDARHWPQGLLPEGQQLL